ncbi:DUF3597 family protein [Bacillus zhangzhouensis]|uniref:DUF3597 family protein n=1 Tax=Bacillus zhangzhouensis TaxID=1178540 RepID=UPI003D1DB639
MRPHQSFSGKYCPRVILKRDGSFDKFRSRIKSAYGLEKPSSSASKPSSKPQANGKGDTKTTSIVDYLKSIGVDSSLENRKKLAKENGIVEYTGTVSQNNKLLEKLREGASKKVASKPKSKPKEPTKTTVKKTVVNGIKTIGEIEIIGVSSSAIIMDVPNRNLAKNIGTVSKGDKKPITGSVKGKNNDKGYWEVVHKGERAYISGQFGKLVK